MKYFFSLFVFIVALVTFVAGRYSIDREAVFMPSLPLAFLHSTQPIVMTVEVTIAEKNSVDSETLGVHTLKGSAEYRFTNLTDQTVSLSFPPTRTINVTSGQFGKDKQPCPPALDKTEIVKIPPLKSITRTGVWGKTVAGDLRLALQGGVQDAYTFSSEHGEQSFAGTLIAFQSFTGIKPKNDFHTISGHLKLVSLCKSQ
jgi:hypothetical protein